MTSFTVLNTFHKPIYSCQRGFGIAYTKFLQKHLQITYKMAYEKAKNGIWYAHFNPNIDNGNLVMLERFLDFLCYTNTELYKVQALLLIDQICSQYRFEDS